MARVKQNRQIIFLRVRIVRIIARFTYEKTR